MVKLSISLAESFLWCISLRNGVKLLGWFFLVGHIFFTAALPLRSMWHYFHCDFHEDPDVATRKCPTWLDMEILLIAIVDTTMTIVQICTSFLLLLGVYQKIPRFIIQWVILQLAMLILDILVNELYFLREFNKISLDYLFYTIWKCLEAYGIYVCYSYYKAIEPSPPAIV